ncbi:carboxypeptidase-like regulatory domain-containing protein [Maribacter algarum]|uniref:Carboxypeptidase-like regulatory domain-containing protein n=1 Tax=Maribacter algarum (ex Zhang et al. 2020) TaxID=2578118 RepID=A0A5S3PZC4_9FLAO|nr:carboxypeptidase-like regulatory domain-containing protein [Maribacter algarum]TMM58667.1 carboxypeptidase-like regulatory domain-containing protein [Maribacter algarum]
MLKLTPPFFILSFVIFASFGQAQTLTSVIVDSATQKPIPYVTVQLKKKGVITNEEGRFTFQLDNTIQPTDSLFISCIGYATIGRPLNQFTEKQIVLAAKAIDLNPVIVTNKNYTPEEIIEIVEDSISKNYNLGLGKKRVFLRETYSSQIMKTDYTLKKSTIDAFNKQFIDNLINQIPKNNTVYNEALGDLYGGSDGDQQKLDLIKASELYDKSMELDFEILEEKFNKIMKENVKTDSYFKIKSGLFGTKVDADEMFESEVDSTDVAALNEQLEKEKESKENRKKFFAKYKRQTMGNLYENLPVFEDTDYNVLFKPGRYELALEDFTYLGDAAVYVLSFTPKRSEEFKGKLYINSDDFALIRMDFENVKPLRDFSLLGVSLKEYLAKGRIIFTKGNDQKYHLSYYDITKGIRAGFRRPLKIIEKNKNVKGRRKQNELSMKVDAAFGNRNRYELVVFDETPINLSQYDSFKENNTVLPKYMPNYDPEFWKGYDIIEPNQAIKEFTSIGEAED